MERIKSTPAKSGLRRIILWTGTAIILLAVLAYFAVGFIAAGILTTPKREFAADLTPAKYQLAYEDIKVTARTDDMQIAAWFIPCVDSSRAVVMVPGRDQSRTSELYGRFVELANYLHKGGLNVMMIDLRGHGQSAEAHYSFGIKERRDVEGAVDWLTQRGFKKGSIGALGISLGAASCLGAAYEEPGISAVAEDSGFAGIYPILQSQWKSSSGLPDFLLTPTLWMIQIRFGYDITQSRPVREMKGIAPRPVMIIHSTSDETVPVENANQLKAAFPGAEMWILSGPEHARSFNTYPEEYARRINAFFNQYLK
jgi:uncharacterized protein